MSAASSTIVLPRKGVRQILRDYGQELLILAGLALIFLVVGLYNPNFLNANNLKTIFSSQAYVAVAAIGMAMVIISGNIDVSVGSLIGVLATIAGTLALKGYPIAIAWFVPVLIGVLVNAGIGILVAYARIPSIVVTLGMLSILKGGLISVTAGQWITGLRPEFFLAQWSFLGVPVPIWFMVVLTIVAAFVMAYTGFGRAIYAVGGNPEAARASGIPVARLTVAVFALHGAFAGIAAVLFATQLQVIQSTVPPNLELTVITAAVIGGVSILGGSGTVIGSTLAAIFFSAMASALVFINVQAYWLRAVIGVLILATVLADMVRRRQAR